METSYLDNRGTLNPGVLKVDLMLRGIRLSSTLPSPKEGGAAIAEGLGVDLILPQNTRVNVPCFEEFTAHSPYELIYKEGTYYITDQKGEVPVDLVSPPAFYTGVTSTGVPFSEICTVNGSYAVITPSPKCDFFNQRIECKYCAGNYDITGGSDKIYTVDEVLETVGEVLKEGVSDVIYLSIGFSPGDDGGIEFLTPYIRAIKNHYNCLVAVEALPPKEFKWIDETYAVGADSVIYNLEIFDAGLFEAICPGRSETLGRKRYLEALKHAAKIFPNGTVASHLIVGLEPPGSTVQGIDYFTDLGVVPILPIYRPTPERALRIEPLTTEIILPIYTHLASVVKEKGINMKWVRDISVVTTPVDVLGEGGGVGSIVDGFYKTKLGVKTAWTLSSIRRKLRVKDR